MPDNIYLIFLSVCSCFYIEGVLSACCLCVLLCSTHTTKYFPYFPVTIGQLFFRYKNQKWVTLYLLIINCNKCKSFLVSMTNDLCIKLENSPLNSWGYFWLILRHREFSLCHNSQQTEIPQQPTKYQYLGRYYMHFTLITLSNFIGLFHS